MAARDGTSDTGRLSRHGQRRRRRDEQQRAGLAIPISIRGQTIGILGVETPSGDHQWTEDDVALIQAVGDQLGQTLETARLFADSQRRAERERLIGEITAKIRASTDMRDILETAATELGQALGTSRALVRVGWKGWIAAPGQRLLRRGRKVRRPMNHTPSIERPERPGQHRGR